MNKSNLVFCTYFDYNYMLQGIALIDSIKKNMPQSKILVLCLDERAENLLNSYYMNNLYAINISKLEFQYKELLHAKSNRSRVEYIFTLTPFLIDYTFDNLAKKFDIVSYVDADTYFFSEIETTIVATLENKNLSIILSNHNYSSKMRKKYSKYGVFNVGIVTFKKDYSSKKCIEWWKDRCIELCPDSPVNGKFADQKYLERFNEITPRVTEFVDLGVNLAPWNISNFSIENYNDTIFVNEFMLKLFHFSNLKFKYSLFFPFLDIYKARLTPEIKFKIYSPYIEHILRISASLNLSINDFFKIKLKRGTGFMKYIIYFRLLVLLFRSLIKNTYLANVRNRK